MQELTFYAVLHKDPSSDFGIHFPDVPGCFSAGSTLEEAASMAQEALEEHLVWLLEDGESLPVPSSKAQILQDVEREGFVEVMPVKVSIPTPPTSGGKITSSAGSLSVAL
jgi:predicted RNase H-like HicB family nuclease